MLSFTAQEHPGTLAYLYGPIKREVDSWVLPLREPTLSLSLHKFWKEYFVPQLFNFGKYFSEGIPELKVGFLLVQPGCLAVQIRACAAEYFFLTLEINKLRNKQAKHHVP